MGLDSLSNIELYFSPNINNGQIKIDGEEAHHIIDVMRHKIGNQIFVTNGKGNIFEAVIENIKQREITCRIVEVNQFDNPFSNIIICLPLLKSPYRFEFALEKAVELGITNFLVFRSSRSIMKNFKVSRWQKILLSAMKQSLHTWLPNIAVLENLSKLNEFEGIKIFFEQNTNQTIRDFIECVEKSKSDKLYLIFGPEGGLNSSEIDMIENKRKIKLSNNRLRTETAIIYVSAILNNLLES
ncbi:16S rRNA (uracil(1498)-N(3))-methyltransferase [Melioribacteraceae bacterium 4301-Me]|uniref:RsmE family RNA methyltransferase n=1 Tax=Pyranulibacter aquaticus TaxID=3163344 RepID=UPI00359A84A0